MLLGNENHSEIFSFWRKARRAPSQGLWMHPKFYRGRHKLTREFQVHNEDQRAEQLVDIVRVGKIRPMYEAREPNAANFQVLVRV